MLYFEGDGRNKGLPAREGALDQVPRGGDGDDHHQSWKVNRKSVFKNILYILFIYFIFDILSLDTYFHNQSYVKVQSW